MTIQGVGQPIQGLTRHQLHYLHLKLLLMQYLITSDNFTWRLRSDNLNVRALKLPVSKGVKFQKDLTLSGAWQVELSV